MIKRKLKIAQIAPIIEKVPPEKYGGIERVVSALTEELVKRGHEVTLFATGDSPTSARLDYFYPISTREMGISVNESVERTFFHIARAYEKQKDFDIIHDHNNVLGIRMANNSTIPAVITLHGLIRSGVREMLKLYRKPNFVSISNDQIKGVDIEKIITIPNGLDLVKNKHHATKHDYLLYVGRISKVKGTHIAIKVAEILNLPLIIAAKLDKADQEYFEKYIKSKLNNPLIQWVGEVTNKEKAKLMSSALCLLNPITWREPFGLTMIEAMSCECPVVTFNRGAASEIIVNGKTGYITKNIEEMIAGVKNIYRLNRRDCREHALKNFNAKLMTDRYEELYQYLVTEAEILGNNFMSPVAKKVTPGQLTLHLQEK